jgi:hypothetical protein
VARNAAGKYNLDVGELRRAFSMFDSLTNRVRAFRAERLALIGANEGPVMLAAPSALVLHFVPLSAAEGETLVNLRASQALLTSFAPVTYVASTTSRYNFDGRVSWATSNDPTATSAYAQVFRNGSVEAVVADILWEDDNGRQTTTFELSEYEPDVRMFVQRYLDLLSKLLVPGPIFVMISLVGVQGAYLFQPARRNRLQHFPIDRNVVLAPEVMFETFEDSLDPTLRPAIDALWNAGGFVGSPNFNDDGTYILRR